MDNKSQQGLSGTQLAQMIKQLFYSSLIQTNFSLAVNFIVILIYIFHGFSTTDQLKTSFIGYLQLVPARVFPNLQTLVTYPVVSTNLIEVLLYLIGYTVLLKIVEPMYGVQGISVMLLYTTFMTGITIFISSYMGYVLFQSEVLFSSFNGSWGAVGALAVASKNCIFVQEVQSLRWNIPSKNFVWAWLLVALLYSLVSFNLKPFYLATTGISLAWFYIRFIKYNPLSKQRGDISDDFSISSFFPIQLQQSVEKTTQLLSPLSILIRKMSSQAPSYGHTIQKQQSGVTQTISKQDDSYEGKEQQRRRDKGLKVLEERLRNYNQVQVQNTDLEQGASKDKDNV